MPRAKTHNAQKIYPHSLHVCVARSYRRVYNMSAAGVAEPRATEYYLCFS